MTSKRTTAKNRLRKAAGQAVDKAVGAHLAHRRAIAGLSVVGAAKKMGRSAAQVYRYESGATRTDTAILAEFAKLYGCKIADFVGEIG